MANKCLARDANVWLETRLHLTLSCMEKNIVH